MIRLLNFLSIYYRYSISIVLNILYFGKYKHNFIGKNVTIKGNCSFGEYVVIRDNVEIRTTFTEIEIGNKCSINRNSMVLGKVRISDGVRIGPNTVIVGSNHNFQDLSICFANDSVNSKGIIIGSNVWIGANVSILDGIAIGDNVVVGAGSVVTKDLPENSIAVGNPCRVVKMRTL
jgi:acetyltransferase-like isoleucine patch superfamily enzyme